MFWRSGLRSIVIPDGIEIIRNSAFECCWFLEKPEFGRDSVLRIIAERAIEGTSLMSLSFADSLLIIRARAFSNRLQPFSVVFASESQHQAIGSSVFYNSGITSINIPEHLEVMPVGAFESSDLTNVVFSQRSRLRRIEDRAFAGCRHVRPFRLPDSGVFIGNDAFCKCLSLTESPIGPASQLVELADNAFCGSGMPFIVIPPTTQLQEGEEDGWSPPFYRFGDNDIPELPVPSRWPSTSIDDDDWPILRYADDVKVISRANVPNSAVKIILKFGINSRLQGIESRAFYTSNLREVRIPKSVEILGSFAFGCTDTLESVTFESESHLRKISSWCFTACRVRFMSFPDS
jgi:hypothetical protein